MLSTPIPLNIAPQDLRIARTTRYDGGGFSVSINDFAPGDISILLQVYQSVKSIYDLWLYMGNNPNYQLLRSQLSLFCTKDFILKARTIGIASNRLDNSSLELGKACHDLNSGALNALVGYAKLISRLPEDDKLVRKAVFLARDHAKMMRNILPDLDEPTRAADEIVKLHRISEFVNKWDELIVEIDSRQIQIVAQSDFDCFITNRCLESSAIDRILYNYINNAMRFCAGESVHLNVIAINQFVSRWIVTNPVTTTQSLWLQENLDNQLFGLFEGGYTRDGRGIGLSNCRDLIAASFGVPPERAIKQQYLGATVSNHIYSAWFHWPIYLEKNEQEPICNCRSQSFENKALSKQDNSNSKYF